MRPLYPSHIHYGLDPSHFSFPQSALFSLESCLPGKGMNLFLRAQDSAQVVT
jgi:hypothetical protein